MSSDTTRNWFTDPPPRRVGVHALIMRGNRLLMVNRRDESAVSRWGLPRGSAAPGEPPRQALSRTLDERLGLRAIPGQWMEWRWLAVDLVPAGPNKHVEGTNWIYEVELPENVEPVITEAGVFSEALWVERTGIAELVVDHALRRIEQCLWAAATREVAELHLGEPI